METLPEFRNDRLLSTSCKKKKKKKSNWPSLCLLVLYSLAPLVPPSHLFTIQTQFAEAATTQHAGFWQVALVIGVNRPHFPSDLSFPPVVNTSSVLISSQHPCHRRRCSRPRGPCRGGPTAALIQRQRCRTAVCTENRLGLLPSHALAGCIHLSNWGWLLSAVHTEPKASATIRSLAALAASSPPSLLERRKRGKKKKEGRREGKSQSCSFYIFFCMLSFWIYIPRIKKSGPGRETGRLSCSWHFARRRQNYEEDETK